MINSLRIYGLFKDGFNTSEYVGSNVNRLLNWKSVDESDLGLGWAAIVLFSWKD
jgi:hypothetical protein